MFAGIARNQTQRKCSEKNEQKDEFCFHIPSPYQAIVRQAKWAKNARPLPLSK